MKLDNGSKAVIVHHPVEGKDWDAIVAEAKREQRFNWNDETPVFAYSETALRCELDRIALNKVAPGDLPLEGRLFDGAGEVRWVAREDGKFDAWFLCETAASDSDDERVVRVEPPQKQKYFLLGRGTAVSREFTEGPYPGKMFKYPVDASGATKPELVRAYILVYEYYRKQPEWDTKSGEEIERLLNEPVLVAHRFVDVGTHGAAS